MFSSGLYDRIASELTKLGQPFGILMSIGSCWFFGFVLLIVIAACINPDLSSVIESPLGQPMAQASGSLNLAALHELIVHPDLLRRSRQARSPRHDVPSHDRPIPHGSLHPRSS